MEKKTYIFHEDAGHGWLAVPMNYLIALGIANKITGCSYLKGNTAYLEEDCDMQQFLLAFREKFGKFPAFIQKYKENSHVRYYPRYSYEEVA